MSNCLKNEIKSWIKSNNVDKPLDLSNLDLNEFPIDQIPTNVRSIDCKYNKFIKIPDLTRFNQLKHFNCEYNCIEDKLILPNSIETLNCATNRISSISDNLKLLKILVCSDNKLNTLSINYDSLEYLDCSNNLNYSNLTSTDLTNEKLNDSIYFDYNKEEKQNVIRQLDISRYKMLKELRCKNIECDKLITSFFNTNKLEYLNCEINNLHEIPRLDNIKILNCSYNSLHRLHVYSCEYLIDLKCSNNFLLELKLPKNLISLNCSYNKLKKLGSIHDDDMKSLKTLDCNHNNLISLPKHMLSLENISIINNPIKFIPEYFKNLHLKYVNISRKNLENISKYKHWGKIFSKLEIQDEYDMYQECINTYKKYVEQQIKENKEPATFEEYQSTFVKFFMK